MAWNHTDFTLTFRRLCDVAGAEPAADGPIRSLFDTRRRLRRLGSAVAAAFDRRTKRRRRTPSGHAHGQPSFHPRNHLVAKAINATLDGDLIPLDDLLTGLSTPYEDQPGRCQTKSA